ncbi:unnamed protein product [Cunninghamella echinulata]
MTEQQYFSNDDLKTLVGSIDIGNFGIISQDSYSDSEIWKTIKQKKAEKQLLCCAIQTAIIGFGNKSYGEFKLDYDAYGVKDDLNLGSKIAPGNLTPRRLQRFFRVQISNYILDHHEIAPYLWKKYSNLDNKYRHLTFPGAEFLVENKDEALYLMDTYTELDKRLKTDVKSKIERVLVARAILDTEDLKSYRND